MKMMRMTRSVYRIIFGFIYFPFELLYINYKGCQEGHGPFAGVKGAEPPYLKTFGGNSCEWLRLEEILLNQGNP